MVEHRAGQSIEQLKCADQMCAGRADLFELASEVLQYQRLLHVLRAVRETRRSRDPYVFDHTKFRQSNTVFLANYCDQVLGSP